MLTVTSNQYNFKFTTDACETKSAKFDMKNTVAQTAYFDSTSKPMMPGERVSS
jgi:hypothetical protein